MAKKPERLTTEDDIKILNSFMSSTQNQIDNDVLDSSKLNIEMGELREDNSNLRLNLFERNK